MGAAGGRGGVGEGAAGAGAGAGAGSSDGGGSGAAGVPRGPRSVAGVAADGAPRGSSATETFRTDRARSSGTGGGEDKGWSVNCGGGGAGGEMEHLSAGRFQISTQVARVLAGSFGSTGIDRVGSHREGDVGIVRRGGRGRRRDAHLSVVVVTLVGERVLAVRVHEPRATERPVVVPGTSAERIVAVHVSRVQCALPAL